MSFPETAPFDFAALPSVSNDADAAAMLASVMRAPGRLEDTGDVVGCHLLKEKIGDGGFGSVWRAEQGEPVRREVALKIIKPGMDTLEVMARFEQERAALSLMDHPNIAKVLDAGATPEGRPFFVMELVRGMPITAYVLTRAAPLEQRLRMFKDVCAGVQHAHQKGIIHRDLKPSNILVAEVDGVPVPKIIDFGIAKAVTSGAFTGLTLHTRADQMIGTPLYMSPEQATGSADVDTRSDVYALGALLYELLAGQPPFDAKTLLASGQEEMRRIIREVEPVPPSRRSTGETSVVRTTGELSATGLRATASSRRHLKDLDLITLRALEKDRVRRYASATALAEDIQRFLNHEPVTARAPSAGYLLRRWMRRNRAAAACLLTLVVGASAAVWQAVRATRSEQRALASAEEADAATRVVLDTLRDFDPTHAGRAFQREDLQRELLRRLQAYPGDPLRKSNMLQALAGSMNGIAKVETMKEAVQLAASVLPVEDPQLWHARHALATAQGSLNRLRQDGIAELRVLLAEARARFGPDDRRTVRCGYDLGRFLNFVEQAQEAAALLAEASRVARLQPALFSPGERIFFRLDHARVLAKLGRTPEALELGRENVGLALAERGPEHYETGRAVLAHAAICRAAGLAEEAAANARRAMGIFITSVGPLHKDCTAARELLLQVLEDEGNVEELLSAHAEVAQAHEQKLGAAHASTAARLVAWCRALVRARRNAEAEKILTAWLARVRLPTGPPAVCEEALRLHIGLLRGTQQWGRAEAALRGLVSIVEELRPQDVQRWGDMSNLGEVVFHQGRHAEAVRVLETALAALERAPEGKVRSHHLPLARQRLETAREALRDRGR